VSDAASVDCPLVFVSQNFQTMTGYGADFCLGRNCRFLQPNLPQFNKRINGAELMLMREFCTKVHPTGHYMVSLLLNEKKCGERFWNLLYLTHVEVDSRPYILAVQSILCLPMPSKIITEEATAAWIDHNEMELNTFVDSLVSKIEVLRSQLRQSRVSNIPKAARRMTDKIRSWMKKASDEYEGDHIVPKTGMMHVRRFEADVTYQSTFDTIKSKSVFGFGEDIDMKRVACALADPGGEDCPLVFISEQFEDLTGYVRDWALGRNCRFLQPNSREVNKLLNSEELGRMRPFCVERQPTGTQIVVILINESYNSFPFFNVLCMEHITVQGRYMKDKPYIFAIQTNLDTELHRLVEVLGMCKTGLDELPAYGSCCKTRLYSSIVTPSER